MTVTESLADGVILSALSCLMLMIALIPVWAIITARLLWNTFEHSVSRLVIVTITTLFLTLCAWVFFNNESDTTLESRQAPPDLPTMPLCLCATLTPSPSPTVKESLTTVPPTQAPPMPSATSTPLPTATPFTFPTPTQEVGLNPTSAPATAWRVAVTAGVVTHTWDGTRFVRRTQALPYLTEFTVDTLQAGWCRLDGTINVYRVRTGSDVWIPWRDMRLGMVYAAPVSGEVGTDGCVG